MNDQTAKLLSKQEIYKNGANWPTTHYEFECPCGKGRIIDERVVGFHDYYAWIACPNCRKIYTLETGCGYIWKVIKQ